MNGRVLVGVGGWTFPPWRGIFYPKALPHKRELEYASRALTAIEINGTYYSTFKPASWAKWRDETPDGFVFTVKASRFCTNRKQLAAGGEAIAKFIGQGMNELGPKLGPILWQFMATKKFDAEDFEGFLKLLPREIGGLPLRHALEVRNESFADKRFFELARRYRTAVVFTDDDERATIPAATADFAYCRFKRSQKGFATGYPAAEFDRITSLVRRLGLRQDAFVYFIDGDKERNPAAAQALIERLK